MLWQVPAQDPPPACRARDREGCGSWVGGDPRRTSGSLCPTQITDCSHQKPPLEQWSEATVFSFSQAHTHPGYTSSGPALPLGPGQLWTIPRTTGEGHRESCHTRVLEKAPEVIHEQNSNPNTPSSLAVRPWVRPSLFWSSLSPLVQWVI